MIYILYNELSNHGKPLKVAKKLEKKLSKKEKVISINIITARENAKQLIARLTNSDKVILLGGDGTIHRFFNHIDGMEVPCRLFYRSCGRGNDFARDYKKNKVFEITHLCNRLPKTVVNNDKEIVFVNGIGMGIDSEVCKVQLENAEQGVKESYFKIACRVFKSYKPYSLDINIDGKDYHYDRVWFFVCNNGRYFGGGMKVTPRAKREDDLLDICIVHGIKVSRLLTIFPLVFLGWHTIFKKPVTCLTGKNIKVKANGCDVMQHDGEVTFDVDSLEVKR